jgi:hypothetical protein
MSSLALDTNEFEEPQASKVWFEEDQICAELVDGQDNISASVFLPHSYGCIKGRDAKTLGFLGKVQLFTSIGLMRTSRLKRLLWDENSSPA